MENASRALVIAGGVLLSLIIIGVVMFAYRGITSLQKEKDISLSNEQVSKINEQIEKYTKKKCYIWFRSIVYLQCDRRLQQKIS